MDDLERLEKLEELILQLQNLSKEGNVIIVEGQRDRRALRELGITGPIELGTKKSLLLFCEELARTYRNAIILTDWDRTGNRLAKLMEQYLMAVSVKVNTDIRVKIQNLVQKRIKDVESLHTHISNLKNELKTTY
ncbi:MAG TPA: toprim domain-containing protein [Candidatus Nanoarchaeia archaeon]|nr:toprim domain-containing protein [Candidatus Nanoarchaeia archaeon]